MHPSVVEGSGGGGVDFARRPGVVQQHGSAIRMICQPGIPPSAMPRTGGGGGGGGGARPLPSPGGGTRMAKAAGAAAKVSTAPASVATAAEVIHGAFLVGGGGSGKELP